MILGLEMKGKEEGIEARFITKNNSLDSERPVRQTLVTLQTVSATQEVNSVERSILRPSPYLGYVLAPS